MSVINYQINPEEISVLSTSKSDRNEKVMGEIAREEAIQSRV